MSYKILRHTDPRYPRLLKEIKSCPKTLFVRGELLPEEPAVAIVGTRKPTPYGIEAAKFFSRALALRGFLIVSGLAFGIDKAAHEACLEAGGRTIAVLGSGVNRITPTSHEGLANRIIQSGGAIVSEFPPDQDARTETFPQRNRIISGLALGVVVVEAPEGSGALITARFAVEQNRDVFVVPGHIFSPTFRGSHALIREGATLVTSPEEIIEALGYETPRLAFPRPTDSLTPQAQTILSCLQEAEGMTMDELSRRTNLPMQDLNAHLTFLEMAMYIRKENEKIYLNAAT